MSDLEFQRELSPEQIREALDAFEKATPFRGQRPALVSARVAA
jgi:hypothetical protein